MYDVFADPEFIADCEVDQIKYNSVSSQSFKECTCGNQECGFDCTCHHSKMNPGRNKYSCEYCGIYTASNPRCSKCDNDS